MIRAWTMTVVALAVSACATLQPLGIDDEARQAGKVTLVTYEAMQQGMIIYGRLPNCDGVIRVCRNQKIWDKIKIADRAATKAITEATPVLNGTEVDTGQLLAALIAIQNVRDTLKIAQQEMSK